jgi:hypothetical protein
MVGHISMKPLAMKRPTNMAFWVKNSVICGGESYLS